MINFFLTENPQNDSFSSTILSRASRNKDLDEDDWMTGVEGGGTEVEMGDQKSQKVVTSILERYHQRTKGSKSHDLSAKKHLPGGDTRASTYFFPYPVYMEKGEGCVLYDCDGNEYIDFLNNYSSLIHGHAHPQVVAAARRQLEEGTVLGSPSEIQYQHAEHLCSRIPSMEMVRYCNSGTEATLLAIRAARAFTGKDVILKMDGGYHGSHDWVEVNVSPKALQAGDIVPRFEERGIPATLLNELRVAPFNDLEAAESILKRNQNRMAALIVEPMLGAGGVIPAKAGYLAGLRKLADQYGLLLIFDEVMTFRLSLGGMQAITGVEPNITALGKIIGGGFPVGAVGGKKEVMGQFDPARPERLSHSGTFNANNITMAAGLEALKIYDEKAVDQINGLGNRLRKGFNEGFKKVGIKGQATGFGSMVGIHWKEGEIRNASDTGMGLKLAADLPKLLHLEMMNRGIFSASRGMYVISTPMTQLEIDRAVEAFEGSLTVLKPYVAEAIPHLLHD